MVMTDACGLNPDEGSMCPLSRKSSSLVFFSRKVSAEGSCGCTKWLRVRDARVGSSSAAVGLHDPLRRELSFQKT